MTEPAVVDQILRHRRFMFVAENPPLAQAFKEAALLAVEASEDFQ